MTPEARSALRRELMVDEGTGPVKNGRFLPYLDCCGKYWRECKCQDKGVLTVAWGRNLDKGLTRLEGEVFLDHDIAEAEMDARRSFAWFPDLNQTRQEVITNMVFNLGLTRFCGFGKAIDAIKAKDYRLAAAEMLSSKWAKQVGRRAERLAQAMRG